MNTSSQKDYGTNTDLFATLCGSQQLVDVAITLIREGRNLEAESILRRANVVSVSAIENHKAALLGR
ncbi:hypothetical protein [Xenorhabdus bovienii]|uniref:Uncharacterized protein n=1 Tax=Xenorhabdus bovienii str. Intermedium TaxID=1379677 RepID=A0A077QIZ3_XENBV|nr:hypothetical protein [Xenorhabdus bovienii]MDE9463505.1 hypothetical protein [Xenorhabdus bovienii]CDH33200.1 hypothetical protein XBI1_2450016 [Xenorhabdus bovienii str. Intermedium]